MNIIPGGITAPKGFKAAGIHCGVKDNFTTPQPEKKDLAMVLSQVPCTAAGTYTKNVVKADPVILTKEYLAVLRGTPAQDEATLTDLLFRDAAHNKSYVVKRMRKGVRQASLSYTVQGEADGLTLVRVQLHTGRTHQIRVQFSSRGLPLLGDIRYGSKADCSPALWSTRLALTHPVTGKPIDVSCPPPDAWPWNLFA